MASLIDIIHKPVSGEWGTEDTDGTGIKVLRTTNFTNEGELRYDSLVTRKIHDNKLADKRLKNGDILIEKSGGSPSQPVGRVVIYEGNDDVLTFNNFVSRLRVKNRAIVSPKYLLYALLFAYQSGAVEKYQNKTTGIINLQLKRFVQETRIPLPLIQEQQNIVKTLESVSDAMRARKKQLSDLDILVKSRFVEMFGTNCFETIAFGDMVHFLRNGANIKQRRGAGGYPITRIETLSNDRFNPDRMGFAGISDIAEYEKFILLPGDILISHINSIAYLGRAVQYRGECNSIVIHGMNLLCARLQQEFNPTYVEWFFKMPSARNYIFTITKKAVNPASITSTDLKKMNIPNPPIELQNQFASFVVQADKSKFVIQQSLAELETLRKVLMQQYFG